MSNKFDVGDRVILTNDNIKPTKNCPVCGSRHQCVGTVVDIDRSLVWVNWDNGVATNIVLALNLSHFTGRQENSLSPNIAFMLYKRSRNESRR